MGSPAVAMASWRQRNLNLGLSLPVIAESLRAGKEFTGPGGRLEWLKPRARCPDLVLLRRADPPF
ncbi:MAG: hypothetical protein K0U70_08230 [Actinomycetia bacterium]|nr:hypothetical protein [Actinomycetes bacterium]MCH9767771.1 hypothetical protein [Actinomycetes bacterium]